MDSLESSEEKKKVVDVQTCVRNVGWRQKNWTEFSSSPRNQPSASNL